MTEDRDKFILLAAVDNRPQLLSECLESIKHLQGWRLVFVGQEFSIDRRNQIVGLAPQDTQYIWLSRKVGMHNAKLFGLEHIQRTSQSHVVASIDDDMEFLPTTDFDYMAQIAGRLEIGLVSGNWVRSHKQIAKKKLPRTIKKQAIVYTAGGLVFTDKITRLIVQIGEKDFWCDNTEWSLCSYLNGYENCRFLGSLAVHKILSAGGRKSYVDQQRQIPDAKYINIRPCKQATSGVNGFHIPDQRDLTALARFTHQVNKK